MELLQKYEKIFDGILGKYAGSDYTIVLKEYIITISIRGIKEN